MWEIFSFGGVPYYGMTNQDIVTKREQQSDFILSKPTNCPDDVYDLMKKCWLLDPNDRITIESIFVFFQEKTSATSIPPTELRVESNYENFQQVHQQDPSLYNN